MARSKAMVSEPAFLNAALEGLEIQKQRIEEQIRQVKSLLGKGHRTTSPTIDLSATTRRRKKRTLSASARKRIAAAQKKRWADFHSKKKAAE